MPIEKVTTNPVNKLNPYQLWLGLLAAKQIIPLVGCSRSHFFAMVNSGKFPPPAIVDGERFTRWRGCDVRVWLDDPQGWMERHGKAGGQHA